MEQFELKSKRTYIEEAIFHPSFWHIVWASKKRRWNLFYLLLFLLLGYITYSRNSPFDFGYLIIGFGILYLFWINLKDAMALFQWRKQIKQFAQDTEAFFQESEIGIDQGFFYFKWKDGLEKRRLDALDSVKISSRLIQIYFPRDYFIFPHQSFASTAHFERFCDQIQSIFEETQQREATTSAEGPPTPPENSPPA